MTFNYDATNIKPTAGFAPVPKGRYQLKIIKAIEKKSRNGDPQVVVDFEVLGNEYFGKQIRFHNVTFLPEGNKGAGIAIHFVKALGEPHEGRFAVDANRWIGRFLKGFVDVEEDWNGQLRNVVKDVQPIGMNPDGTPSEEEVPF
jgi:hypothetical protein